MISVNYSPPSSKQIKSLKGSYWHTHTIPNNCDVQNQIKKLIGKKFKFDVLNFSNSVYTMVGANDVPRPHIDKSEKVKYQCLIFMHGEESTNNGTGFYTINKLKELELSIHVGFKCNRAIFFSSDVYHTPLQWAGNGSFRYSICNFFT
jgi:hypothetical protein|tara:strand:+ start:156 stop:599 length:444 start_codon:yes stop_codon:yes gene_type:complete